MTSRDDVTGQKQFHIWNLWNHSFPLMYHTTMLGRYFILTLFWWRHNDVTERFDRVDDVIIRKIVEKYWDRESIKKFYGAVFFVLKINRITVRPLKFSLWRKSYAHMRLKKRFKIFFSLEFHFIQFKKRKIFHIKMQPLPERTLVSLEPNRA